MFFVYKFFTWTVVILIALFGATLVGAVLGALGVTWVYEEALKLDKPRSQK